MAVPRISKDELKLRLEGRAAPAPIVLDARLKYPYEHSTITLPGAIRIPPGTFDPSALPLDHDIILFDSDPDEIVAEHTAARLIQLGYRAYVLQGGIGDWAAAKYPVDTKTAPKLAASGGSLSKS